MAYVFTKVLDLQLETTGGVIEREKGVEVEITVGIHGTTSGHFELYDIESGGERWYAEGSLSFENKELTDFDGVFELPSPVVEKLKELGYDTSYVD